MEGKLYVLVRKDLSKSQQAVQAGHAVAEYLLRGPKTLWGNGVLVYLSVRDECRLESWARRIKDSGYNIVKFKEPDSCNETTAIAFEGADELVKNLRLL
jgi:hypothetical protein